MLWKCFQLIVYKCSFLERTLFLFNWEVIYVSQEISYLHESFYYRSLTY